MVLKGGDSLLSGVESRLQSIITIRFPDESTGCNPFVRGIESNNCGHSSSRGPALMVLTDSFPLGDISQLFGLFNKIAASIRASSILMVKRLGNDTGQVEIDLTFPGGDAG